MKWNVMDVALSNMTLAIYSFIRLLLLALLIAQVPCPAAGATQSVTDFVFGLCNAAQFNNSDAFGHNLNAVVASLSQKAKTSLYASAISQAGSSNDSYAYGMYQCRGDVSLSDCSSCVTNAFIVNPKCASNRGARVRYRGCYIRYEFVNYLGLEDDSLTLPPTCSSSQDSSMLYQGNLAKALDISASAAPKHALFGYNASTVGTASSSAFALAQCLGDLSPSECARCLSQVSNHNRTCPNSVSGEVYFNSCFYIFNNSSFLFTTSTDTSPPDTSPPPATPPTVSSAPAPSPNISSAPTASNTSLQGKGKGHSFTAAIVGIVAGTTLLLVVVVALALCFIKRQKKAAYKLAQMSELDQGTNKLSFSLRQSAATRFSLDELREATDDFHVKNKLGQGGFGPVYKGTLKSGREVAIKMLSAESHQGRNEFMNEVNLITTVQHRNLIQLIGCCVEDSKRFLVYEYLPNRSLDLHLFDVGEDGILDWHTRFEIILGISRGMRYLHEDSHDRIVHRDVKASNILLDNNLNAKIADFGLARFFADDITHVTTRVVGTMGYLAPEYVMSGKLTDKADVYSFGIVALEIVSGRRVIENRLEVEKPNLLEWTWALYESQQQLEIVDARLIKKGMNMKTPVNVDEVIRVVHVALLCTQSLPQARPSMSQVHTMLSGQSEILELPTKPITIAMLNPTNASSVPSSSVPYSCSEQSAFSNNAESISELDPR